MQGCCQRSMLAHSLRFDVDPVAIFIVFAMITFPPLGCQLPGELMESSKHFLELSSCVRVSSCILTRASLLGPLIMKYTYSNVHVGDESFHSSKSMSKRLEESSESFLSVSHFFYSQSQRGVLARGRTAAQRGPLSAVRGCHVHHRNYLILCALVF